MDKVLTADSNHMTLYEIWDQNVEQFRKYDTKSYTEHVKTRIFAWRSDNNDTPGYQVWAQQF